jgi:glycosyltransferase involved in cell wall biosynthesis
MTQKRILVAVTSDVYSDMRVCKVADFLSQANDVKVVGRNTSCFSSEQLFEVKRFRLLFNRSFLFYLEFNFRFFFYGLLQGVDVIVANDLDTLLACYLLSKIKKATLVYDSHEYFTESVGLQNRPLPKKIWTLLEKWILPKVKHFYTVSQPIADAYFEKYKVRAEIVRNFPVSTSYSPIQDTRFENKKIILYQGVLNPHRGLENTIEAMRYLTSDTIFVIIGYGELETTLSDLIQKHQLLDKVCMLGKMPYTTMMRYTQVAHLGIALEEPVGDSFRFSLPNKVFDYIHSSLPFISLGTPEVRKIIEQYGNGILINYNNPQELAEQIDSTLNNQELLNNIQQKQQESKYLFTWEQECIALARVYDRV